MHKPKNGFLFFKTGPVRHWDSAVWFKLNQKMETSSDYSLAKLANNKNTLNLAIDEQISELADIIISLLIKEMIKTERENDDTLERDET